MADTDTEDSRILQPARAIVGHCPKCEQVVIITNNYEVWPLVVCHCGHRFATSEVKHHVRVERGGTMLIGMDA